MLVYNFAWLKLKSDSQASIADMARPSCLSSEESAPYAAMENIYATAEESLNRETIAGHTSSSSLSGAICNWDESDFQAYNTNQDTKCFDCTYCSKQFSTNQALQRHLAVHTGERKFTCSLCNKGFIQKTHLILHERRHSGIRPFECEICFRSFYAKQHLVNHYKRKNHQGVQGHGN